MAIATAVPAPHSTVGGGTGHLLYGMGYTTAFHTIELNTGEITDLTFPPDISEAHWMPDGHRYMITQPLKAVVCFPQHLLSRMGEPQEPCLGFMTADTLEVRMFPILPFMPQLENLAISPDGNQIAFLGWPTDGSPELQVVRTDGTGLHDVTQNGGGMSDPAWSPDGRFIAYTHQTDSSIEIRRTGVDGSGDTVLVKDAMRPAWSPDGQSLVYVSVS